MKAKDILALAVLAALLLALLSPALWSSATVLASFGDLFAYHYPLRHLACAALQAGRLPFWNPYIFCGVPLSANSQAGLFYPGSLLGRVLPLTLALSWDCAGHLFWGGLGLLLLARREGLRSAAALFLASLYVLSPFLLYRIAAGIPTLLASLAWVPWCWLAWLSRRGGLLAAVWALQFLSGHPQFLLANAVGMTVWAVCHPERRPLLTRLFLEGLGAAALAAAQWPSTWRFVSLSVRRNWPPAFLAAYAVSPRDLLTWLWPDALGNPLDGTWTDAPSVFFESAGVFLGWAGLLAAAAGLCRGARRAAVLVVLGVFLALGWHNPLYRLAAQGPAGLLRTPSRYLCVSLWGLILAAGAAARRTGPRLSPAFKAFLLAAAVIQLFCWGRRFVTTEDSGRYLAKNEALALAAGGRPCRVLTDPDLASADKTMLYRAMNVNGYDAFYLAGYPAFAAASEGRPAADPSRGYLQRPDTPAMRLAGVAYKLTADGRLLASPGALPLAFFASATGRPVAGADVQLLRPERWRIRGDVPAGADRLVLSAPSYPGWRAWLGGVPVRLSPWGFFQEVSLPAGAAAGAVDVILDFQPVGWSFGVLMALAGWLAWLAVWAPALRSEAA